VDILWIGPDGVRPCRQDEVPEALARADGFVWVDIPQCGDAEATFLRERFGLPESAVQACRERSIVPKLRPHSDHVFLIVHAPEPGEPGQIRLLELDQFIGVRYLVTVHGPYSPGVPLERGLRETTWVADRIRSGRFLPGSPAELSYAIVGAIADGMETLVSELATRVSRLERQVLQGDAADQEAFLEEMFRSRHEFLSISTLAGGSREVFERLRTLSRSLPGEIVPFAQDLADQFDHVGTLCNGEKEFLQEILDFYVSRTTTQMNVAMKRLAMVTVLLLPLTAIASIYGMNIIAERARTNVPLLVAVLSVMAVLTTAMLRWAKRQGWW
jgi:magnesium transporter